MRPHKTVILGACLAVGIVIALGLMGQWVVLRTLVALPLIFVLPGYALMAVVFPGTSFTVAQKVLLSLCGSMCISILGSLILNMTSWGLKAESWFVFLVLVVLSATMIVVMRPRTAPAPGSAHQSIRTSLSLRHIVLIGVACVVFGMALTIARTPVPAANVSGYSQLWIEPGDTAKNTITFGIQSKEFTAVEYRADLRVGDTVIQSWSPIALTPNQTWVMTATLPAASQLGADVSVHLYRLDNPQQIYRNVVLRAKT